MAKPFQGLTAPWAMCLQTLQEHHKGQHGTFLIPLFFKDLFCIWVCLNVSYLLYLFCIYKGHKRSGLFLTNFPFLWFLTLAIILVKTCYFPYISKIRFVKHVIIILLIPRYVIFVAFLGPLWLVTSWATGTPPPLYSTIWV